MSNPVVKRQQCPVCLDTGKDNLAIYADGGEFCYGCNSNQKTGWTVQGKVSALKHRFISEDTCKFFNYQLGRYTGRIDGTDVTEVPVHIANYYAEDKKIIRQKIRTKDKQMKLIGPKCELPLFGQWKWTPDPNLFVTVVEGEIDALSVVEVQGIKFACVSIPMGSNAAKKSIEANLKWLLGWKYVILAFDNDEAGTKAVQDCLPLFEPGKVKVAEWPLKDANDMLKAGRGDEIKSVLFMAKSISPDHLVTVSDIIEEVMIQPQYGTAYPFKSLTTMTYGFQLGEVHIIVAANGIGKTEYVKELMFHFMDTDVEIGLFSFEQGAPNTLRRLVGAKLGIKLHLPGSEWNAELIRAEAMKMNEKIYLCKRTGSISIDELFISIRYLAKAKNKRLFVVDNIRGLGIGHDTELAGNFMRKLQALCLELQVTVFLLSHVSKDKHQTLAYVSTSPKNPEAYKDMSSEETQKLLKKDGMDWSTGRMPHTVNVDGPSVICDLADYVWGLARNKDSEDFEEQHTIKVKALKTRLDGEFTGKSFKLFYNSLGRLEEIESFTTNNNTTLKGEPF